MSFRTRVILHVLRDILRSCAVTSEKAGTSLIESPEKKGIRVERYSHKYPSVAKIYHYHWNRKYSFKMSPKSIIILDAPHMVTKSDVFSIKESNVLFCLRDIFGRTTRLSRII